MATIPADLFEKAFAAARGAAQGYGSDVQNFILSQGRMMTDTWTAIAQDVASGDLTPEQGKAAFDHMKDAWKDEALALDEAAKAAAQDAINAAFAVISGALNKALGLAIF